MFKKTLIAAALAVATTGAFAQGMTFQGAFGQGTVGTEWPTGKTAEKNSSTGSKLVLGFEQDKSFGWEVGYYNFGKAKGTYGTSGDATHASSGLIVNAIWSGNSGNFTYRGGIGGSLLTNKVLDVPGGTFSSSTTTLALPSLTAGVGYQVSPSVTLTADVDIAGAKYKVDTVNTKTSSLTLLSFGARFKF